LIPQVLHIKSFRDLWLGQAISQLGDAFFYVVFMFMAEKVTGSLEMVGYVGALEAIPYLLFSPYAGVLADRLDRKRIMLVSDLVSGFVLLGFVTVILGAGKPPAFLILALAFALSTVRCFFLPAKSAAIPSLVPEDLLLKANALSSATQSFMPLIGLSISAGVLGVMYAIAPDAFFAITVGINALSFLGSAIFIARLPKMVPDRSDSKEQHPVADFVDGMRYVARNRLIKVLIAMLTVFRLMVSPFFVAYVAANKLWFGGKPQTLAWFEFFFFLGVIGGSAWAARVKFRRPGYAIAAGFSITGLTVAAMAFSPFLSLFCLWNLLAGIAVPFGDIPINTMLQVKVHDAFRGRVNSVLSMVGTGIMPVGLLLAGLLVQHGGLQLTFLVMGLGMVVAAMGALLDREFRRADLNPIAGGPPELVFGSGKSSKEASA
jgi:MFS transporter, DHA3 family, macrolide efflux protein